MNPFLRIEHISKAYKNRVIVADLSFEVKSGEIVGLLGPNGAGKTTSFYMIAGLIRVDQGRIFLGEQSIENLRLFERARLGIGYLPQENSVFKRLSVWDNIELVFEARKFKKLERKEKTELLLEQLGLNKVAQNLAGTLSGGERRRTEIARSLALDPLFLLLDESFTGIDPLAIEEIQGLLKILKAKGIGILITDHNVRETLQICDFSYVMQDGKIQVKGTAAEIVQNPLAKKYYLGENFSV